MNYLMIRTDDMLNGSGLRVILFLSACTHKCEGCHNPETWNPTSGMLFDSEAKQQIFNELNHEYISGITFSGGDPLHENNTKEVLDLIKEIKDKYPNKNIWLYTGYAWGEIISNDDRLEIAQYCDVIVDGEFKKELLDVSYPWAGSTNQRVIDVQASLNSTYIVLYGDKSNTEN